MRVQTKAALAGGPHKPPKGRKTLTENHWPSRLWGLGGRPITCSRKIQKITETVTYQEQISNGEAVAVDGRTAGHTMTSMGESLRETHKPTRSLATPKSKMRVGCWNIRTMYTVGKAAQVAREMERYIPVMTKPFIEQKSHNRSPLSFMLPNPCFPITPYIHE